MDFPMINLVLAVWTMIDGFFRKMGVSTLIWSISSLIFGPFVFPFYKARKPLPEPDTHANGMEERVLKWLAICWALVVVEVMVRIFIRILIDPTVDELEEEREQMTWAISMGFALVMSCGLFLAFSIGALIMAFVLRTEKPSPAR